VIVPGTPSDSPANGPIVETAGIEPAQRSRQPTWQILQGDSRAVLATLPEHSVHTCITSPPYFGLRDYGHDGQIGLEPTPDEFVAALVDVFREVRRVLRDDGTVWLNLGDSYANGGSGPPGEHSTLLGNGHQGGGPKRRALTETRPRPGRLAATNGIKAKDLVGIPWMVAFALRADGWYLRSEIIWAKPNPMPESVTDRPTKAHEYLFLLSKGPRYYYDADAIREENQLADTGWAKTIERERVHGNGETAQRDAPSVTHRMGSITAGRNKRSVWTVATQPYPGAHFATFPPKLIEPCILAGCPEGGTVLDPFAGAGTTGMVALRHNRSFVGIELNPEYARMARQRIIDDAPLLNHVTELAA
jgi:DNA modification methylase